VIWAENLWGIATQFDIPPGVALADVVQCEPFCEILKADTRAKSKGFQPISLRNRVCGRDSQMNTTERARFDYRASKISIEGAIVSILTYDGLMEFLQSQIEAIKSYA
jgi:hypothetical protein